MEDYSEIIEKHAKEDSHYARRIRNSKRWKDENLKRLKVLVSYRDGVVGKNCTFCARKNCPLKRYGVFSGRRMVCDAFVVKG
jgi:hypothetical protein